MKKRIFTFMVAFAAIVTGAQAQVAIDETNFPDANFRAWLMNSENINGYGVDGTLTDAEIDAVKEINVDNMSISDLTGIKHFTSLENLSCRYNLMTSLDLSDMKSLLLVVCDYNPLTSLNVTGCLAMKRLLCRKTQLTSIDVSGCSEMYELSCGQNELTTINVTGCSSLVTLACCNNHLRGAYVDALIDCLPTVTNGELIIVMNELADGNEMTAYQVAAAKAKGWQSKCWEENYGWVDYLGTGINAIESDKQVNDNWYSLDGRRIEQPMKGVYVTKGRKVVIK